MQASITEAEFATLAKHAGLTLDPAQQTTLYDIYGHLEAMLARLRQTEGGGQRGRAAEPAHIFRPEQEWPEQIWRGQGEPA